MLHVHEILRLKTHNVDTNSLNRYTYRRIETEHESHDDCSKRKTSVRFSAINKI